MRAKQFFYMCAGILMLVVAYHIGASRAIAQGGPTLVGLIEDAPGHEGAALDSSGRFYWRGSGVWSLSPTQAPSGTPVAFIRRSNEYWVGMAGGDIYAFPYTEWNPAQPWQFTYVGNIFGGTVQVEGTSITDVKKKFRED